MPLGLVLGLPKERHHSRTRHNARGVVVKVRETIGDLLPHPSRVDRYFVKGSFWSIQRGILVINVRAFVSEVCVSQYSSSNLGYNTGYKHYDPSRPCTKCWLKYSKPFTGPLAYSYSSSSTSSNTQNTNLQKPLPLHVPGPNRRIAPSLPPRPGFQNYPSPPMGGYSNRGSSTALVSGYGGPPPGAVVYSPGDPRIGGNLCWSCNGKGSVSILIDKIRCPVCGGCGRTFNHYSY